MEPKTAAEVPTSQLLLELTHSLLSARDPHQMLSELVRRVALFAAVDRASIVLLTGPDDSGCVVAASDDPSLRDRPLDLRKYPEIRHALQTKQPLSILDARTHPLLHDVQAVVASLDLRTIALLPLVWQQRAVGVLFLRCVGTARLLASETLRACEVLANLAAMSLVHTWLEPAVAGGELDLPARVQAAKRLDALLRYTDLFSSAADGLAAFDVEGRVLFANPSAHRILAYGPGEALNNPIWDLVPREHRRNALHLRQELARGVYPHDFDLPVRRKDGRAIVLNGSFSALDGRDGAILLSFRDVTAERKTRAELVHTRNFLQSLIDASVDAIVAADMQGTIILFNKGAQQLYGYRPDDAIGKMNVRTLYPHDGAREVMRMLRSPSHGGVGRLEPVRIEAVDKNGTVFPISLTSAMIFEGDLPTATFGIFTDLRERARVEHELAEAQERLASSEKQALVAELAGAAAHELNQPLTSVMGYSELLLRKLPADSANYRAAQVIHGEAERMAEIVRKIGKLTRYETKSYVGDQRILDLDRASVEEPERPRGPG